MSGLSLQQGLNRTASFQKLCFVDLVLLELKVCHSVCHAMIPQAAKTAVPSSKAPLRSVRYSNQAFIPLPSNRHLPISGPMLYCTTAERHPEWMCLLEF